MPGVRGVVRLGEAMVVIPLVKRALPAGAAAVPGRLRARRRGRRVADAARWRAGTCAASAASRSRRWCRVAPALFALRGGELAAYHGVEHKSIAAYEQGAEDASEASKEHERCGSHLVAPMLASNLAGTLLLRRALEKPGPVAGGAVALGLHRGGRRGLRVVRAQHRDARSPRRCGGRGSRSSALIGTREPDERQLEVGRAALAEILRVET